MVLARDQRYCRRRGSLHRVRTMRAPCSVARHSQEMTVLDQCGLSAAIATATATLTTPSGAMLWHGES